MENIFQEYSDPFYKETVIDIKECNISFLQLDNIYFIESQLNNEKKDSIFKRYISRLIEIIRSTIERFINKVKDFFKIQEHMTTDDYLNSNSGQIQLSKDIEKINKQIDEEIIKGSKLIQSISTHTHIDDTVVADFLNRTASLLKVGKHTIIKNTVAKVVLNSSIKKCKNNMDKINEIEDSVNKSSNDLDDESKEKIQKIISALKDLVNGSIINYSEILSKLNTVGGEK